MTHAMDVLLPGYPAWDPSHIIKIDRFLIFCGSDGSTTKRKSSALKSIPNNSNITLTLTFV